MSDNQLDLFDVDELNLELELENTQNEIEFLKSEIERLKECIGNWRRKAQDGPIKRECLREGFNADTGSHYKQYILENIPGDLSLYDAYHEIKKTFLPKVHPYQLSKIDYSNKYKGWLVEVKCHVLMHFDKGGVDIDPKYFR